MPEIYIEAEYKDGFVLQEDEADVSPYDETRNIFHAIQNRLPEAEHGKMVRFSLIVPGEQINVDFTILPDNARPIRFKHMERCSVNGEWVEEARIVGIDFGYQYTKDGKNFQEVVNL